MSKIHKRELTKSQIRQIRRTYPTITEIRGESCYLRCGCKFSLSDILSAMAKKDGNI